MLQYATVFDVTFHILFSLQTQPTSVGGCKAKAQPQLFVPKEKTLRMMTLDSTPCVRVRCASARYFWAEDTEIRPFVLILSPNWVGVWLEVRLDHATPTLAHSRGGQKLHHTRHTPATVCHTLDNKRKEQNDKINCCSSLILDGNQMTAFFSMAAMVAVSVIRSPNSRLLLA